MRNASLFDAPPVGVGELCRQIKRALESAFPQRVRVVGEISGCHVNRASGHAYFTLKDPQAGIACICYGDRLSQLDIALPLPDGLQVEIRGRVTTYSPQSKYQIIVDDIVPVGRGELHRRFEQLKQQLSRDGLFARERKRPLPEHVRCLAIVTSREGAALQDFLTTCRRRGAHLDVIVVHTPVQGEASATRVATAIRRASTLSVDVVVVARGGGSLEDLWAFNTEVVAREIAACAHPVISAVGHETDVTIADFVADVRAATPTAAAELISPDRARLLRALAASESRLIAGLRRALSTARDRIERTSEDVIDAANDIVFARAQRIDELEVRLRAADPRRRAVELRRRINAAGMRLRVATARAFAGAVAEIVDLEEHLRISLAQAMLARTNALQVASARLSALGPTETLRRGYAIVFDEDGVALVDSTRSRIGDSLDIELHRGRLRAEVTAKEDPIGEDDGQEEG